MRYDEKNFDTSFADVMLYETLRMASSCGFAESEHARKKSVERGFDIYDLVRKGKKTC